MRTTFPDILPFVENILFDYDIIFQNLLIEIFNSLFFVTFCSKRSTLSLPLIPKWLGIHTDKLVEKIVKHDSSPIQPDIVSPPLLRLTSRKPLWLDLQSVDIKSRWRHGPNWKSAQVVNSHLVCNPTIRQPGLDLSRQQWSLLNRFRTDQGHCGACRRKWRLKEYLWRDPDDVSHCRILSADKTEWRLISATLCG